jgi:DNA-directed RNA polymerase specialized sigma subunit
VDVGNGRRRDTEAQVLMKRRNSITAIEQLASKLHIDDREYLCLIAGGTLAEHVINKLMLRTEAIAALCEAFEPLVQSCVKRRMPKAMNNDGAYEEMLQDARLGVLEACTTFNRKKGAFPSHVRWHIQTAINRFFRQTRAKFHCPSEMIDGFQRLQQRTVTLAHKLKREPTIEELSVAMKLSVKTVTLMLQFLEMNHEHIDYETDGETILPNPHREWIDMAPSTSFTPEDALLLKERIEKGEE